MRYWQRVAGALGLAISLLGAGCGSAAATATPRPGPRPTFTPPPTEGRLLFVSNAEGGGLTISELKDGLQSPRALWTGIPGRLDGDKQPLGPAIAVSPDRKRAMLITASFEVIIIDLASGGFERVALPAGGVIESAYGVFSPDSRRLAYAVFEKEGFRSRLYTRDLAAGKSFTLYQAPCRTYSGAGESRLVCGGFDLPVWLDENTLAYGAYIGEMPKDIFITKNATWNESPAANRHVVTGFDGTAVRQSAPNRYFPTEIKDQTAVGDGWWMEATDLKQGVTITHSLAGRYPRLSPNGESVVQDIDQKWHVTTLRTGIDQEVGYTDLPSLLLCHEFAWSPGAKAIACRNSNPHIPEPQNTLWVLYLDTRTVRRITTPPMQYLLAWVPNTP